MANIEISPWSAKRDSVAAATRLLHRAYGKYLAAGVDFGAATQDDAITRQRIETATATWVAISGPKLVGIISYYDHRRYASEPVWYQRAEVGHFGQFAVDPEKQGGGIGHQLLREVEARAINDQKLELSCDTAIDLRDLVNFYQRMGYRDVGRHRWPHADFETIVLSKSLRSQQRQVEATAQA